MVFYIMETVLTVKFPFENDVSFAFNKLKVKA